MDYIIIGAGISGLSIANMLKERGEKVVVFESENRPGGMIKCDRINGSLFHRTGGHVFNTKRNDVLDWFWKHFDKEKDFIKAERNSSVAMPDGKMISYPIENHVYMLGDNYIKAFIQDLINIVKAGEQKPENFEEFLRYRFGETLFQLYFQPYNYKVWRRDLTKVPLSWLEGKLPMPSVQEMIYNNINHIEEKDFVHSSFYYAKYDGSQFLANKLAENITIYYNSPINEIVRDKNKWVVNGINADRIIFCGNIKQLPELLKDKIDIAHFEVPIQNLESHGTTTVFCEIERNPYSWIYMPSNNHYSHRIICTGNFSPTNNSKNKMTGTIEFTDYISKEQIEVNLSKIPFSPKYLTHHYEHYTYPIQSSSTRNMIKSLKNIIEPKGIFILGRFAEWEYYNMDVAMGASIDLVKRLYI